MDSLAMFYQNGGFWMHPITLVFILCLPLCIADAASKGRFRLSSICLALVGTALLSGSLGFLMGLTAACEAAGGLGDTTAVEQRQVMLARGLSIAITTPIYAMFTAVPLLGLTMLARVFHRPPVKADRAGGAV